MNFFKSITVFLLIPLVFFVIGCADSDDDDSTPSSSENMKYNVDSEGLKTITDSSSDALYGKFVVGTDPRTRAETRQTEIKANGSSSRPEITIWFNGKESTGTFGQADGAKIYYYETQGATPLYFAPSTTCADASVSVTVTSYGAVGGTIDGTYEGTLVAYLGRGQTNCNTTKTLSGTFSVTRDADQNNN